MGEIQVRGVLITGPRPVESPAQVGLVIQGGHHELIENQGLPVPGGSVPTGEVQDLREERWTKADQPVSSTPVEGAVGGNGPVFAHVGDGGQEVRSGFGVVAQQLTRRLTPLALNPVPQT